MSLIHFYDPITEFDRLFEDAFAPQLCHASLTRAKDATPCHRGAYRPRLNLHESKDTNTMTATFELPGLTSENVTINVHQNRLTVAGESSNSRSQEEGDHVFRERPSGKFSRTLQLTFGTKPEDVTAKMENGVLTVTFPKTSPEQQATRIAIQ